MTVRSVAHVGLWQQRSCPVCPLLQLGAAVCPCVVGVSCHLLRVWLGVCPGILLPQLLSDGVLEHFAGLLQEELMELVLTSEQCVGCWVSCLNPSVTAPLHPALDSVLREDWLQMWAAVAQLLACPALLRENAVLDRLIRDEVLHRLWAFLAPTVTDVTAGRGKVLYGWVAVCSRVDLYTSS